MDALIDTGSCVTLMRADIFQDLCTRSRRSITLQQGPQLHSVAGTPLDVLGQTEWKFDDCKPCTLVIIRNCIKDCILGIDFLRAANAQLLIGKEQIILYGRKYVSRKSNDNNVGAVDTEHSDINEVLKRYDYLFSTDLNKLGHCEIEPCNIDTQGHVPIKQRPYRLPLTKRKIVEEQIKEMQDAGVIRPSSSPWASPVVLVPKKDGSTRFCIDYRKLNSISRSDAYSLPSIQEIFDSMHGTTIFSTMDLTSGYWQFPVDETSIPKTAFCSHMGNYEFVRMPFGLKNAPAIFQRTVNKVLSGLIGKICWVYIDDIVVFSKTPEEHALHLSIIFDRLTAANLKLKRKKCFFGLNQIDLLGYTLTGEGISPQQGKVDPIKKLPPPTDRTGIRSFLGMTGYYRQCIKDYAQISKPLQILTSVSTPFYWGPEQQQSFDLLKSALTSNTIMAYPNVNQPYKLYTDACNYAIGGILVQVDSEGIERPIHYLSHQLNSCQRKWATIEKEAYAIVYALQKLRPYLWGADFTIYTDHKPLKSLFLQEVKNTKIQRWAVLISEFGAPIKYREGKNNIRADMLSRIHHEVCVIDSFEDNLEIPMTTVSNASILLDADKIITHELITLQRHEFPDEFDLAKDMDEGYELGNDHILYSARQPYHTAEVFPRIMLPSPYHEQVCKRAHEECGHMALEKTMKRIQDIYVWPGMRKTVREYIAKCAICITRHGRPPSPPMSDMPLPTIPFDTIGLDLMGPLATSHNGNKYILAIVDHCSGWAEAIPLPDKRCATVENAIMEHLFPRHGWPRIIIQDNGLEFNNKDWLEDLRRHGTEVRKVTPYHPQTNGKVERFNRSIKEMINRLVNNRPSDWERQLNSALLAHRNVVSDVTGYSPFFLLYGRSSRLPLSAIAHGSRDQQLANRLYDHDRALQVAKNNTERSRKYNRERINKRARDGIIKVGDHVVLKAPPDKIKLTSSFDPQWTVISRWGPVLGLRHQVSGKNKTINISRVKLCDPNVAWDQVRPRPIRKTRPTRPARDLDQVEPPIINHPTSRITDNHVNLDASGSTDNHVNSDASESTNIQVNPDESTLEADEPMECQEGTDNEPVRQAPTGLRRSQRILKRRQLSIPTSSEIKKAKRATCLFIQRYFAASY